jgi:hypothetical protein
MQYGLFKAFEYALFFGLIIGFLWLAYMAWNIRYTDYIRQHPFRFLIELSAFSILPSFPLWLFMITRGLPKRTMWIWFITLWFKFALLHIFFEISGVYQYYFGNHRITKDI